jgi:seryl-tRNA synthetase
MLDIKFIRENTDLVKKALGDRALKFDLDGLIKLDDCRRKILSELEELRAEKNRANDEISALLKSKQNTQTKISSMKTTADRIDCLE